MAAYKMAAVKFTPPNDFPLGPIRSHMVVIHLFLMLCDLQRVVRDLCPILYNEERYCWCCSPGIIRVIQSRKLRWTGRIAGVGKKRNAYRILVGKAEGK
jgi:hypothetical protein